MRRAVLVLLVSMAGAWEAMGQCTVACSATAAATGQTNVAVPFQSRAAQCNCGSSPTYAWTFGDGGTSTDANPSYTYTAAGTYNWQLTVTAGSGTCTKSGSITITSGGGVVPSAGTYSGTTSAGRPFSVTVNASSQITSWTLGHTCFGTGTTTTNTTCNVTNGSFTCGNAFCSPFVASSAISGTFSSSTSLSGNATFRFTPNQFSSCCTQTPTFTATLSPAALSADANADTGGGTAPLTVNFTASASGGTPPYTYHWNFGDCTATSSTQNPSHQYIAGNWTAFLTVTDSQNATATDTVDIAAAAPPFGAPGGLVATASGTTQVNVTWNAVSGVDHYEVARSTGGAFTTVASPVGTSFTDSAVAADTSYVYKVRAISPGSEASAYSAPDAATTIVFADDPLVASTTIVKAVHMTSLRTAVNAMHVAAGLGAAPFTDTTLTTVKKVHIDEARAALDAARAAIGLPALGYTDTTLSTGSTLVKAAHVQEVRNGVK